MIFRNQKMLAQHALTEAKLVRQLHRAYDFLVAERQLPGLAQRGYFKGVRNCNVKFHEVRLITAGAPPVGATPLSSSPGSYWNMAHLALLRRSVCFIAQCNNGYVKILASCTTVRADT